MLKGCRLKGWHPLQCRERCTVSGVAVEGPHGSTADAHADLVLLLQRAMAVCLPPIFSCLARAPVARN